MGCLLLAAALAKTAGRTYSFVARISYLSDDAALSVLVLFEFALGMWLLLGV